jgi:glucose-1-phosphate cytidylyltransferase
LKVVILCGGQGTRLREETEFRPKPLVEVGGRPILWHIMKLYAHYGFADFVLCLGYKGSMIRDYFLNYDVYSRDFTMRLGDQSSLRFLDGVREEEWQVTLAETGTDEMTGARVKRVEKYVVATPQPAPLRGSALPPDPGGDRFMVTYGDGLGDVDLARLLEFHQAHGKIGTVTAVRPPSRFGELAVDGGVVTEFNEKPQAMGGLINGGFFIFERRFFDYLGQGPEVILEREPLMKLARDRQLVAYEHEGFWQPMDTFREYQMLNDLWRKGKAPWKVWR